MSFVSSAFVLLFGAFSWGAETISIPAEISLSCANEVKASDLLGQIGLEQDAQLNKTLLHFSRGASAINISRAEAAQYLREIVQQHQRKSGRLISLSIPENIKVSRVDSRITEDSLRHEIKKQISLECADCEYEFYNMRVPNVGCLDDQEIRYSSLRVDSKGAITLPVSISLQGKEQVFWVTALFRKFQTVPVAARQLIAGERLQAGDVEQKRIDTTFGRDSYSQETEVVGQVLSRTIAKGQAIFRSDIKREAAVLRGQIVNVRVGGDSFEIVVQGIVESPGYIGDMVKVKNLESSKSFSALVTGKGEVEVR